MSIIDGLTPVPGPSLDLTPSEEEIDMLGMAALGAVDDPVAKELSLSLAWFTQASVIFVDAILNQDSKALSRLDSLLRRVRRAVVIAQHEQSITDDRLRELATWESWTRLMLEFVRSGSERLAPIVLAAGISRRAEQFLRVVADHPGLNSRQIAARVAEAGHTAHGTEGATSKPFNETQLSRLGTKLRREGLVSASRGASGLSWTLTPRGQVVLDRASATR